jgi:hypothetical protein
VERRYEGLADAREQRELGVRSWSVAAVQLDELSEGAGLGHRHLFFSTLQVRRALGPGLAPVRGGETVAPHEHEPGEE